MSHELTIKANSASEPRQRLAKQLSTSELLTALRARMSEKDHVVQVWPFETPEGMEDAPYKDPAFLRAYSPQYLTPDLGRIVPPRVNSAHKTVVEIKEPRP